jgi:excisionase family DNA binding protein
VEDLLSTNEAAMIIGVSPSTISRMKKDGLLPFIRLGKKCRIPRRAVEELKKEREQGLTARSIKGELAGLKYEVEALKRQINFLMLKLQVQDKKWHFTDGDLLNFYSRSRVPPKQVELKFVNQWLEVGMYLNEKDYDRLAALTSDPHPWRRPFKFVDLLVAKIKKKRRYRMSIELQQAAHSLILTQKEIRKCGLVMLTTKPATQPPPERFELLLSDEDGEEIDPDEMLQRMQLPSAASPKDRRALSRLSAGSTASPKGLPEGRE